MTTCEDFPVDSSTAAFLMPNTKTGNASIFCAIRGNSFESLIKVLSKNKNHPQLPRDEKNSKKMHPPNPIHDSTIS